MVNFSYSRSSDDFSQARNLSNKERLDAIAQVASEKRAMSSKPMKSPQANISIRPLNRTSSNFGESLGQFAGVGSLGQTFTPEQEALHQMFGGGDKIWGTNQNPVDINHDLNPSQRGDMGTAEVFGFGGRPQRSGLF